jgi:hypothetical protein
VVSSEQSEFGADVGQVSTRNVALRAQAIAAALRIQQQGVNPARWVNADTLRELRPR